MGHRTFNGVKTAGLLGLMTALILLVGYWLGGSAGLMIAVLFSLGMNGFSYFYSDRLALRAMRANIAYSVDHLRHDSPLMEQLIRDEGVLVIGAEYSLETGVVTFFDDLPEDRDEGAD